MRISVVKKLLFAPLFLFLLFALFGAEKRSQDPSPSPSPSVSPSPSPRPSATPTPLPGAQNFHQWGSITVFNGLPSDSVRAIAQTNDGVMWFGTDNGLARFDGRKIQNFSLGGSETSQILSLKTSPTGELWVGTRSGAYIYSDGRFTSIANTENQGISTIYFGSGPYLGTDKGYVLQAANREGDAISANKLLAEPLTGIDDEQVVVTELTETDGNLVIATSTSGLFAFKNGQTNLIHGPSKVVNALAMENGLAWIGTDATKGASGIYRSNGTQFERVSAPTSKVLTIESNDAGAWAGSERFGLFQFTGQKLKKNYTFENTSGGLRSNTVFTLFTDREGVLWIGTNRGVSRFDQTGALQETVSDIPNSNFVRTLYKDGERTLAGTNRGLFAKVGVKDWGELPQFRNKVIYSIAGSNTILIGAADGAFEISGRKLYDGDVRSFASVRDREYVADFGFGVSQLGQRPSFVMPNESVTTILGFDDNLWIGTAGQGLYKYDGKAVQIEGPPEVLKSGTVWRIFKSEDQTLYIAGQHGVFSFRAGVVEQIVAVEDVRDVYTTNGHVWAATTTRGLLHARRDERFGWLVSAIGFEQGLPSEKAFSILPTAEGLLIGTNRGVVKYSAGTVPPKIIATRVLSQRAHDLSELAGKIDLEYPQNSLLVEVAGQSSRTFPEEFQYAFVLTNGKGEEVARQLSNEPQYAPSELKPGDYTIEAIAFNRDLLASEPLFIHFSVAKAPFPWTATALGILLAIAIVGLVWAVFEHRRIRQRNRELAAARFDLANEAERERRRIARDLHDQTLADLRNLMLLSDKISPDKPEFRSEIESVSSEIRRICEDLSPSVLENVGLVASLEFLLKRTIENSKFTAEENLEDRIDLPMNAQLQVYRIAQEVLTNIKKHSSADRVDMSVSVDKGTKLCLEIKDNGERFEQNGKNSVGRGIANIRARASLINAKVHWSLERENGNRFTLEVDA
jgi:signal transduction histidine kinase/ligand-binding sensor domain-containing protein